MCEMAQIFSEESSCELANSPFIVGTILKQCLAKFCSMYTLEMCGDILQPGGQLESTGHFQMVIH